MIVYANELNHYGVLGMKWGVRRYRNADGTLTDAGKKRKGVLEQKRASAAVKINKLESKKDKIKTRYNTVGNKKREARTARLKEQRNNMAPKVSKLETRLAKGKKVGFFGKRTLTKAYKLDKAISRSNRPYLRYQKRLSNLEINVTKLQKRINKYNRKLRDIDPDYEASGKRFVEEYGYIL